MPNRQNKKGRSKTAGHFVMLTAFMLNSAAWRALKPAERAVYVELRRRYYGQNNGSIALSVRDAAERCNINKDTARKALSRLQELGFIECATPGGFSLKLRHATEWRLLDERCDKTGALPTKAFMRWRPVASESKARSEDVPNTVPSNRTDGTQSGPQAAASVPPNRTQEARHRRWSVPPLRTHIHSSHGQGEAEPRRAAQTHLDRPSKVEPDANG